MDLENSSDHPERFPWRWQVIDEKSRTQALDRTQPGLPLKSGKCGTMTHDYKRNGTTALFAALNTLEGTLVGRCMPKQTHKEFFTFLNAVDGPSPPTLSSRNSTGCLHLLLQPGQRPAERGDAGDGRIGSDFTRSD
ncbi:hypothetical protein [Azospirillum palustre]